MFISTPNAKNLLTSFMETTESAMLGWFSDLPTARVINVGLEHPAVYRPAASPGRPILVAHTDTVWDTPVRVRWRGWVGRSDKPDVGIGADDRAGVAALWAMRDLDVGLLLLPLEESGCIGSRALIQHRSDVVSDILDNKPTCLIQFDRCGSSDFVYYDGDGSDIEQHLGPYFPGYSEALGSFSDVAVLAPAMEIAGVNVSIGFADEHTEDERINANVWRITVNNARQFLLNAAKDMPQLPYFPAVWSKPDYGLRDSTWDNYHPSSSDYDYYPHGGEGVWLCEECGEILQVDGVPVEPAPCDC